MEETKSTNETNETVKHLLHTNELLQQNITALEQVALLLFIFLISKELSNQRVEVEKKSILANELESKLSQVASIAESLQLQNKGYEDEIASLTFREKAVSSESLMRQLSELIQVLLLYN